MAIQIGDTLPDATFMTMTGEGPQPVAGADLFAGKKVVLFGVPGAFTPTCHHNHLPGYIEQADAITAKGVDTIACVSVNDAFVMGAWDGQSGSNGKVLFLADGNGDFTRAVGLQLDASGFGMGERSVRYSMIVDDGKVVALNIEPEAGQAEVSGAAAVLKQL